MVSTIDDFERETRTWLKQCMQAISGYPEIDTVAIKSWTNSTRPDKSPNNNTLLGYNSQIGSLETISPNGSVKEVFGDEERKSIALLCYPIGSYYFTSDNSFNPNNTWGGKWERLQEGRVLISESITHSIGEIGGSETVSLIESQIPKHSHPHTHTRGTMNITGFFPLDDHKAHTIDTETTTNKGSGAFYASNDRPLSDSDNRDSDNPSHKCFLDASRSWTGETSKDNTQTGNGQAHNNMQPYRVCAIWHRTA